MTTEHTCGTPWVISSGPGRFVGPGAGCADAGRFVELPDDFWYEYCPKCNVRNMTPELKSRLFKVEQAFLARPKPQRVTEQRVPERLVYAPHSWHRVLDSPSLFLAGSIEMGAAKPWQDVVIAALSDWHGTILNPRRPDWDSTWEQSIDHPEFRKQVEWELNGLAYATHVVMYFDPATKSPITLLELGLAMNRSGTFPIVCCPEGYWRKGNVDIVCKQYDVPVVDSLEALIARLKFALRWSEEKRV